MSRLDVSTYTRRVIDAVSQRPLTAAVSSSALLISLTWTVRDFQAWKDFGTGGLPPNAKGYLMMTVLRLIRLLSFKSLRDPSSLRTDGPSYLRTPLTKRTGDPPQMMPRTMPHRQVPGPIEPAARERVAGLMKKLGAEHPELLTVDLSKTEGKTTDAIYAKRDLATLNPVAKDRLLDHEIAHAHPSENSLHVWLSDRDARAVIEAGWGERFPIPFVKSGWTMVYAPRNEAEVDLIEGIVKAGVGWITGVAI